MKILTILAVWGLAVPIYSIPRVNLGDESQQQIRVSGKVTDAETGAGMAGVNITVKGTPVGTISDAEGNYSLSVSDRNATMAFSFIGYVTREIALNGRTALDVALSGEVRGLDEVVVVGYGTQKKASVTGALTMMKAEEVKNIAVPEPF